MRSWQSQETFCFYRGNHESAGERMCQKIAQIHIVSGGRDESEIVTLPRPSDLYLLPASGKPLPAAASPAAQSKAPEEEIGNPESESDRGGIAGKYKVALRHPSTDNGALLLPDGTELWLGSPDAQPELPVARVPRMSMTDMVNFDRSRIHEIFGVYHYLKPNPSMEAADLQGRAYQGEGMVSKQKDPSQRGGLKTRPPPGGLNRTPVNIGAAASQKAGVARLGFGIGGLVRPSSNDPDPGGGGEGDGGGGGDGSGGRGGHGGTPITPGWTNIDLELDPVILGEEARPYTKESCKKPFLMKIKELFKEITERTALSSGRPLEKFNWLPTAEDPTAKENGTFLSLIISHIVLNTGPVSLQQNGMLDFFRYPQVQVPVVPIDPNNVLPPLELNDHKIQGVKVDLTAKHVLTGVSQDDPRQFFSVVDDGDNTAPENPEEVFLRPALVLAYKMLKDLRNKKIKPTIISRFAAPYNFTISGHLVVTDILTMLEKATEILHCVFEAQLAADNLADALEEIREDRIDEIEREFEELVVGGSRVPGSVLRDRVLKLSEGARAVNRMYNAYEMTARAVDNEGIKEDVAKKTFANPALLVKFLRNCSERACPWIKDSKKWSTVKPCLTQVSATGEHTVNGDRLKIMQSPSRLLVERSLTHVDDTIARIADLKQQVFSRIPPPSSTKDQQKGSGSQVAPNAGVSVQSGDQATPSRQILVPQPINLQANRFLDTDKSLRQRLKKQNEEPNFEECFQDEEGELSGKKSSSSPYPHNLLNAATDLCQFLLNDGPGADTPAHILTGHIDQLTELIKEIQKVEWTGNVHLTPEHQRVRNNLNQIKTILRGYLADHSKEQKSREAQEREVARSLSFAKGPVLKEEGENIDQYLEYHEAFRASCPLARALKMKNDLPPRLQKRVDNISDPDDIVAFLKDLFLQSDILIPQAMKLVTDQRINPKVNSREEQASYTAINSLIQRLEKQNLLGRLDFTMISACLARLSPQRIDEFELSWLKTKMVNKGISTTEEEKLKRDEFISFIQIHEILLQKRTVQSSLNKREEKEKKSERAFHTRETKLDKRKKNKEAERGHKSKDQGGQYVCPLCHTAGGHPHRPGHPRAGLSHKTLARCEVMRNTPPNKRMDLVLKLQACTRCLQTSHQVDSCRADENSHWLTHAECPKKHNPFICPLQKVERQNATKIIDQEPQGASSVVINLAEKALLKDQSGRTHSVIAVHDSCSDSSWVSSELAKSFPPNKRKRVNIPLQTIQGTNSFMTWEYHLQIQVGNAFKAIKVYESPSIGSVQYNDDLHRFLQETFQSNIHLPQGDVSLLIGLRDHGLSPNSLPPSLPQSPTNLKLYQSALVASRRLACGTIPTALIPGLPLQERSMFTQSELTKILTQYKGIDNVPQLCDSCNNKSLDCSECKLLNRASNNLR